MNPLDNKEQQDLRAILQRIIRVGTVTARYPAEAEVQVEFRDLETPSWRCPVLFPKTGDDKYYTMPDDGERVVVLSLPYGKERGLVIGAFYNDNDTVPSEASDSNDRTVVQFEDGTAVIYDRDASTLEVKAAGDVTVDADKSVLIKGADGVDLDGGSGVTQSLLTNPKAISQFTGNPVGPPSSTLGGSA